jgi:hypothetical protein
MVYKTKNVVFLSDLFFFICYNTSGWKTSNLTLTLTDDFFQVFLFIRLSKYVGVLVEE